MDAWQVFSYARKLIPLNKLRELLGRERSSIYGYAAPPTNEIHLTNPITRITAMLNELDMAGRTDVARAAVDIMAEPLGGCFAPLPGAKSDKGSVDGEAADALTALARLTDTCRDAMADRRVTKNEMGQILENIREVRRELDEMYDVVQRVMRGGSGGRAA